MTDNDLQEGQARGATPWYDPETGELGHAIKVEETIEEIIETDDPGVLAEAEAPQSPPFGTPSRQDAEFAILEVFTSQVRLLTIRKS